MKLLNENKKLLFLHSAYLVVLLSFNTHSMNGFSNYVFRYIVSNYSRLCDVQISFICNRR